MEARLLTNHTFYNWPRLSLAHYSTPVTSLPGKSRFGLPRSLSFRLSPATPIRCLRRGLRVDASESLTLDSIRHSLIRQEDSIIFNLLERAQYRYNANTYDEDAFTMEGFQGSLVEFMIRETEQLHAKVDRYKSPDEHPFFPQCLPEPVLPPIQYPQVDRYKSPDEHPFFPQCLPEPVLPPIQYPQVLHHCADSININKKILSKRIHYGKFVAEAKFREDPATYETAIREQDRTQLLGLLTYETVEEVIKKRVEVKARIFGQDITVNDPETGAADPSYKINPSLVAKLYGEGIMPLTKEVQIEYLLRRLD
ncbi:hypothetical protein DY000_02062841 [Brassica cretica]|uniref:Chorismate mutase n=1 Tax=Brassica cretica TaxID=69181 RepID=A0ABQ7ARN2_BRACR|nr:hypothetical protein DY000_02062841 [Brassica cretica]